ncbi:hypothetical protein K438DRAFT_1812696 [Mycena galopus ATCC 62051]|nr:hypothetical protein K438DRAFT_1812696 [Mycena galopus ATCC 62051]
MALSDSDTPSYVYPIRSLLSGSIQRARNDSNGPEVDTLNMRDRRQFDETSPARRRRTVSESSASGARTDVVSPLKKPRKGRHRTIVSNFRHFPGEDSAPNLRRTFAAISVRPLTNTDLPRHTFSFFSESTAAADIAAPAQQLKVLQDPPHELRARPKQIPVSDDPLPPEEVPDMIPDLSLAWNESQLDFVRLPPLPSDHTPRGSQGSKGSSLVVSRRSSQKRRDVSTGRNEAGTPFPGVDSGGKDNRWTESSMSKTLSGSGSESQSGSEVSDASLLSVRFQHVTDENGHHLIVGREGKLSSCEDEPIRTPGAVQGFGVLIAVDELEDALVVRQVSENAGELLGLSPRHLFSLECFTDTLPESQAGVLWDNIQFLSEFDHNTQKEEASPHVFLLTGWGAPGTAAAGDPEASNGRRSWTCWCAVHRPPEPTGLDNAGVIIMEFELERDMLNPLYPVADATGQGPGSPRSESGSVMTLDTETPTMDTLQPAMPTLTKDVVDPLLAAVEEEAAKTAAAYVPTSGPTAEEILESTTSRAKPLLALARLRRTAHGEHSNESAPNSSGETRSRKSRRTGGGASGGGVGVMDIFAVMAQINEQLGEAPDLAAFLQVVVGVIKDLSQFHRVLVYQFDELWNGEVVAELLDWSKTRTLYQGLHFPAADIPAQARQLYAVNKVRLLYDRSQSTARIVVRSQEDLKTPLNMTHCYLRAMSPIHVKFLENMGVRASMSISIMAFGALWGLVTCHSYGTQGMRVSFPVRQMMRLLSQSISRNIERLSYAQRLGTRRLINTMASDNHPTGYIVSNADDLLGLFDADFGMLIIGSAAKMLGPNEHGQEILIIAEYLRLKQFTTVQVSQAVTRDYEELARSGGLDAIAGMLYVPLSSEGKDFICFLRKGQPRHVHWAGNPNVKTRPDTVLEPRKSFEVWSETVAGRSRAWTDEQLETAGVLALVYGKFIEVWRQKENALQTTRLTNLLLSNASHEVRTPLNHIINYLEMALNGSLDEETRDNLIRSHAASKSLLFTINDLLDLTRLESGNTTSFNEPFDLQDAIAEATHLYRKEAQRRNIAFNLELENSPQIVVGDSKKIQTMVQNLTANSLKYTTKGSITIRCTTLREPEGLRGPRQTAVEMVVADTGCGIDADRLGRMFHEFEALEPMEPRTTSGSGIGLGLAVVARIVGQLGGQLRVESKVGEGSRFSFLIPLELSDGGDELVMPSSGTSSFKDSSLESLRIRSRKPSLEPSTAEIESLVEALSLNRMVNPSSAENLRERRRARSSSPAGQSVMLGVFGVSDSSTPLRPIKVDSFTLDTPATAPGGHDSLVSKAPPSFARLPVSPPTPPTEGSLREDAPKLRVLIVEDNVINRTVLAKRLRLDGHDVVTTTNGQEALDQVTSDRAYDAILMDIQMPILDGYAATQRIRALEKSSPPDLPRLSNRLNGGHIPIFAVSASLQEKRRQEMVNYGLDGWILKPIDFQRLKVILTGVTNPAQRVLDIYRPGCSWETGGWLPHAPPTSSSS